MSTGQSKTKSNPLFPGSAAVIETAHLDSHTLADTARPFAHQRKEMGKNSSNTPGRSFPACFSFPASSYKFSSHDVGITHLQEDEERRKLSCQFSLKISFDFCKFIISRSTRRKHEKLISEN